MDLSSFQCIEMAIFDTSSGTGSFIPLNDSSSYTIYTGDGFEDDIKIMKVYNDSDVGVIVSYDGITNHDYWPPGATIIIDLQTNHADNSAYGAGTLYGRKGQVIWGSNAAGTGNVYISGYR